MSKRYKIFDIDYLQNNEFTEEDLMYLFETSSFSLSLIVEMFKSYDKQELTIDKILNIVKTDSNWMYKHFWNDEQRNEFLAKLMQCYKNMYRYSDEICEKMAEMWLVQYGFTNDKQKNKKTMLLSD